MIEDYYIDLYHAEKLRMSDGTGGFEYVYKIGDSFKGTATKASSQEQLVAGVWGNISEQYTITTYDNNVLELSDIIMFENVDKKRVFLRINSEPTYTPEKSNQSRWKYVTATLFNPDLRVVN